MAANDTKTWIGSTGPFLSDSIKPISGLQTDKVPTTDTDAVTLGTIPLGEPIVISSGISKKVISNYQLLIFDQIEIIGTLEILGQLVVIGGI